MAEDNFYFQYPQMMNEPDQFVDPDLYNKFVEDVTYLFDDDASGESLLSFDSGIIKPLPASRDHRCLPTTTDTTEDRSLTYNMETSVLMSNAPGHSPIFGIDDEYEIQRVCGSSAPSYHFTPVSCFPHEVSPPEFYGNMYGVGLCTPVLSPPSSTSSAASSLPTETPPPGIQLYPQGIYELTTEYPLYTHPLTEPIHVHHDQPWVDSFDKGTISPEDITRDYWGTLGSRCDYELPNRHSFASPATTTLALSQNIHLQPVDSSAYSQESITSSKPHPSPRTRPYPAIIPTLSPRLACSGVSVTKLVDYSQWPEIQPTSSRYRLRSDFGAPAIAATNVHLELMSNPQLSDPLPPHVDRDVGRTRQTCLSPLSELLTLFTEPCRESPKPGPSGDHDHRNLPDGPLRNAPRKKRRKSTKRGPNHRFFCKWPGCTAGFTRLYDQTRHEAKHKGEGKETCRFCGEELSRKDSLNRHMASRHRGIESYMDSNQGDD